MVQGGDRPSCTSFTPPYPPSISFPPKPTLTEDEGGGDPGVAAGPHGGRHGGSRSRTGRGQRHPGHAAGHGLPHRRAGGVGGSGGGCHTSKRTRRPDIGGWGRAGGAAGGKRHGHQGAGVGGAARSTGGKSAPGPHRPRGLAAAAGHIAGAAAVRPRKAHADREVPPRRRSARRPRSQRVGRAVNGGAYPRGAQPGLQVAAGVGGRQRLRRLGGSACTSGSAVCGAAARAGARAGMAGPLPGLAGCSGRHGRVRLLVGVGGDQRGAWAWPGMRPPCRKTTALAAGRTPLPHRSKCRRPSPRPPTPAATS